MPCHRLHSKISGQLSNLIDSTENLVKKKLINIFFLILAENTKNQWVVLWSLAKQLRKMSQFSVKRHFHLFPFTMITIQMPFHIIVKIVLKPIAFPFHAMNVFELHTVAHRVWNSTQTFINSNVPDIRKIYG